MRIGIGFKVATEGHGNILLNPFNETCSICNVQVGTHGGYVPYFRSNCGNVLKSIGKARLPLKEEEGYLPTPK